MPTTQYPDGEKSLGYGNLPDQTISEWTPEYYMACARFVASRYNMLINPSNLYNSLPGINYTSNSYVLEYMENLAYIKGSQVTSAYGFFVQDYNGNKTQVPMMRGLDIKKIYNHIDGQARKTIKNLPKTINAQAYSKDAVSARKSAMDYAKFQIEYNDILQEIQTTTGLGFKYITENLTNQNQISKYFQDFQETMEIAFQNLAKNACFVNDFANQLPKAVDTTIIGNLAMFEVEYSNGQARWSLVPPECAIVDYSKNDDQHLLDDFAGRIYNCTLPELFMTYEFTEDEVKNLNAIAISGTSGWSQYNTFVNGLNWWVYNNGVPKVTVAKTQWRSIERNEDGTTREVIREADLIANIYVRNERIAEAQIPITTDSSRMRLKYVIFTPDILLGCSVSIVGIVKRYQDLKDAFSSYLIGRVSTTIGKSVAFKAGFMPDGLTPADTISQLKQTRVIILEGADTDNPEEKSLAQILDLDLDPNLTFVLNLIQYYDGVIADILNIPPNTRGMLQGYQPVKNVENSQNQSTVGMGYFYEGLINFYNNLLSYSANLMKLMAPDDEMGRDSLCLTIGDAPTQLLSMDTVRDMQFEHFKLSLNCDDVATEQDKLEILDFAKQLAATGGITMAEYVKLKQLTSLSEMQNYIEECQYKREMREDAQLKSQQDNATKNAQINSDAQIKISENQAQLTKYGIDMNSQTKLQDTESKNETNIKLKRMEDEHKAMEAQLHLLLEERQLDQEDRRLDIEEKRIQAEKNKPKVKPKK